MGVVLAHEKSCKPEQIEQVYWSPCGAAPHKKHEIFAKKQLKSCTT